MNVRFSTDEFRMMHDALKLAQDANRTDMGIAAAAGDMKEVEALALQNADVTVTLGKLEAKIKAGATPRKAVKKAAKKKA